MTIDTSFDFRSDTRPGKDPDSDSSTLHRYHQLLWSKPLPTGPRFDLEDARPRNYLLHRSDLGVFYLASDTITTRLRTRARTVISQIPEAAEPRSIGYTVGSAVVFPQNTVGKQQTINGARGFHPKIADRFDLTLECIRRHYTDQDSPLGATLLRYGDFFSLFGSFTGYVNFFLLQDLVSDDGEAVEFFTEFEDFKTPAVPQTVDAYLDYRRRTLEFVEARNQRIAAWAAENLPTA